MKCGARVENPKALMDLPETRLVFVFFCGQSDARHANFTAAANLMASGRLSLKNVAFSA